MSVIASAVKHMLAAGMEHGDIVSAVAEMEAAQQPQNTTRQDRNRRYYQKKKQEQKASETSESVLIKTDKTEGQKERSPHTPLKEKYTPPIVPPRGEADKPRQKSARQNSTVSRPEDVPEQIWTDFVAHRKQKRAAVTQTALDGFRREAGKAGVTLSQAMALSCERGWQGFKAEWVKPGDVPKTEPQKPTRPVIQCNGAKYVDDVEAAVKRFFETGYWEPKYGYRPDNEWTDVPGWMIEKYGGVDPRQNIIQFQQDRKSGAA